MRKPAPEALRRLAFAAIILISASAALARFVPLAAGLEERIEDDSASFNLAGAPSEAFFREQDFLSPALASLSDPDPQTRQQGARILGALKDPRAVAGLAKALAEDADFMVRMSVAEALGKIRDPRSIPPLVEAALQDPIKNVSETAAESLARLDLPEALASLEQALGSGRPERRKRAVSALAEFGDLRAGPLFASLITGDDGDLRNAAHLAMQSGYEATIQKLAASYAAEEPRKRERIIEAFSFWFQMSADSGTINTLILGLRDPEREIRLIAAQALAKKPVPEALDGLLAAAAAEDGKAKLYVLRSLAALKDRRCLDVFLAALEDSSEEIQTLALFALRDLPDPISIDALAKRLAHSDAHIIDGAVSALGAIEDERAARALITASLAEHFPWLEALSASAVLGKRNPVFALPELSAALRSESPEVRARAALFLSLIDDPRGWAGLKEALADPNPNVRRTAVRSLSRLPDADRINLLIGALGDGDTGVRLAAADALRSAGDKRAIAPLIEMLAGEKSAERIAAAGALAAAQDESAVEPLIKALADPKEDVRKAAANALAAIPSPAAGAALEAAALKEDLAVIAGSYRYFIGKGVHEGLIIRALNAGDDSFFATVCLNSENPSLANAAKEWARRRGYAIISGQGRGIRWGSSK